MVLLSLLTLISEAQPNCFAVSTSAFLVAMFTLTFLVCFAVDVIR
jgi:hypothetical protein